MPTERFFRAPFYRECATYPLRIRHDRLMLQITRPTVQNQARKGHGGDAFMIRLPRSRCHATR